ncbi:MAG: DUF2141 domain-containing protein [Myxococcota bacterium]
MNRFALTASLLATFGLAALPAGAEKTESITFNVKVNPKLDGEILCALYDGEERWLSRDVFRHARVRVRDSRWVTCTFDNVPAGTYGIAGIHDEDGDEEIDKTLGIPTEGYTTSRNAHEKGIYPDWEDASFRFSATTTASQVGHMNY